MAGRRKKSGGGGGDSWLNTYADMVTLLLTFFVLLFSMSTVSPEKWLKVVEAFSEKETAEITQIVIEALSEAEDGFKATSNIGGATSTGPGEIELPEEFDDVFKYLKAQVEAAGLSDSIEVAKGEGFVFLRFKDSIFFDPDQSKLRAESYDVLEFIGKGLHSIEDQIETLRIDGHTAAIPGVDDYHVSDRLLSAQRANAVLMFFEDNGYIAGEKLIEIGFGKWRPIASNDTAEGKIKNRRVEMLITKEDSIEHDVLDIYELLSEVT